MKKLTNDQFQKFARNGLLFTAPALAVFFNLLNNEVELKQAALVAVLAFYGLIADYLRKMNK